MGICFVADHDGKADGRERNLLEVPVFPVSGVWYNGICFGKGEVAHEKNQDRCDGPYPQFKK